MTTDEEIWLLLESAPVAIVAVRLDGTIYYANRLLESLFGYPREELIGQPIEILLPERFRASHVKHRSEYAHSPRIRAMGSGMDLAGRHKNGTEFPIEAGLSHLKLRDETIVMSSVIDISRRKQNEALLEQLVVERTSEIERRRSVAEGLRYILALLNSTQTLKKTLDYVVGQAQRLMDADACVLYQLNTSPRQTPDFDADTEEKANDCEIEVIVRASHGMPAALLKVRPFPIGYSSSGQSVADLVTATISDLSVETQPEATKLNQHLLVEYGFKALLSAPISLKEQLYGGVTLYYREPRFFSTEDAQLATTLGDHAALAIENARLRAQVEQSAVKAERSRIARDLHDSVTQTLFSANLIADILPVLQEKHPEEGERRIAELRELTKGALAEMRTLLLELRPGKLADVEIRELFQQLADAIHARARIPISLSVDVHGDRDEINEAEVHTLPTEVKTALFYIAQEALNNVAKHANASQAALHYQDEGDRVILSIIDNGVGFEIKQVAPHRLGLNIMAERAAEIGAQLTLLSSKGQGTEVHVSWQRRS